MNTSFERTEQGKDEWLTPPEILHALGDFDLDPCSPVKRPWDTAKKHYTIEDNGLIQKWEGRVWCNPPYGDETELWLRKMAEHQNGIALVFSRTDTEWFHETVFNSADGIFFIKGRLRFYHSTGIRGGSPGSGSVLISYGIENTKFLTSLKMNGKFLALNNTTPKPIIQSLF